MYCTYKVRKNPFSIDASDYFILYAIYYKHKLAGYFLMNVKGQEKVHLIENQDTSALLWEGRIVF